MCHTNCIDSIWTDQRGQIESTFAPREAKNTQISAFIKLVFC